MNQEEQIFFSIHRQLPVRLNVLQVACVLNCGSHCIRILVKARLLKPLGNPPENGEKMFSRDEILELANNKNWLERVTNAIHRGHHEKNETRKDRTKPRSRQNGIVRNGDLAERSHI